MVSVATPFCRLTIWSVAPMLMVTLPVAGPLADMTPAVIVTGSPATTLGALVETETVTAAGPTSMSTPAAMLAAKFRSPAYSAVISWSPASSSGSANMATPLTSTADPAAAPST
ncbi:hypothetical protein D3C87_1494660 [compost metagenome]